MTNTSTSFVQFKGLEARPGNLKSIFEKNMMLARNKMLIPTSGNMGFVDGGEIVRSAIPSFEANSLRASLAPPEPIRKTAEEVAEEQRILREAEEKRQEAIRVAREAEERRRAEDAEKERKRLAEIARKEAQFKAKWDAAHQKVKIDLSKITLTTNRWADCANEKFEETRHLLSNVTGYFPPRLSDSQAAVSPIVENFVECLSPRSGKAQEVAAAAVVAAPWLADEAHDYHVATTEIATEEVVVLEAGNATEVVEEKPTEVVEVETNEELVIEKEASPQYTQAEPVITAEEVVVSPVSVTTQECTSPLHKPEVKEVKEEEAKEVVRESCPTTATTSLDVEDEEHQVLTDPVLIPETKKEAVTEERDNSKEKAGKGKNKGRKIGKWQKKQK